MTALWRSDETGRENQRRETTLTTPAQMRTCPSERRTQLVANRISRMRGCRPHGDGMLTHSFVNTTA